MPNHRRGIPEDGRVRAKGDEKVKKKYQDLVREVRKMSHNNNDYGGRAKSITLAYNSPKT